MKKLLIWVLIIILIVEIGVIGYTQLISKGNQEDSSKLNLNIDTSDCSEGIPSLIQYTGDYEYSPYPEEKWIIKQREVRINTDLLLNKTPLMNIKLFEEPCFSVETVSLTKSINNIIIWEGRIKGESFISFARGESFIFLATFQQNSQNVLFSADLSSKYGYQTRIVNGTTFLVQIDKLKIPFMIA